MLDSLASVFHFQWPNNGCTAKADVFKLLQLVDPMFLLTSFTFRIHESILTLGCNVHERAAALRYLALSDDNQSL